MGAAGLDGTVGGGTKTGPEPSCEGAGTGSDGVKGRVGSSCEGTVIVGAGVTVADS